MFLQCFRIYWELGSDILTTSLRDCEKRVGRAIVRCFDVNTIVD